MPKIKNNKDLKTGTAILDIDFKEEGDNWYSLPESISLYSFKNGSIKIIKKTELSIQEARNITFGNQITFPLISSTSPTINSDVEISFSHLSLSFSNNTDSVLIKKGTEITLILDNKMIPDLAESIYIKEKYLYLFQYPHSPNSKPISLTLTSSPIICQQSLLKLNFIL